jgi:hypothetical protein
VIGNPVETIHFGISSLALCRFARMDCALDLSSLGCSGHGEIVRSLQVQPELRGRMKYLARRSAVSAVTPRRPWIISVIRVAGTRSSRARLVDAHPEGFQVVLSNCLSRMGERDLIVLSCGSSKFLSSIAFSGSWRTRSSSLSQGLAAHPMG